MLKTLLFGPTPLPLLKKGLDAYALRHKAIADNIANVETPGYVRHTVKFEEKLDQAMLGKKLNRTHSGHLMQSDPNLDQLNPELKTDPTPSDVGAVNNVDMDREMTDLAKNNLEYTFAAQMAKKFYEIINSSIRGS